MFVAVLAREVLGVELVAKSIHAFPIDRLLAKPTNRAAALVIVLLAQRHSIEFEIGATNKLSVTVLKEQMKNFRFFT